MASKGGGKHPVPKAKKKIEGTWGIKEGAADNKGTKARMRVYYPHKSLDKNYVTNESMEKARETYKKRGISTRKLGRKSKI